MTEEEELQKRNTLEKYKAGLGVVWLNKQAFPYFITRSDMPMLENGIDLQAHLGYWGKDMLFISEAIPSSYRSYMLKHELREHMELGGVLQPGACLEASTQEWTSLPSELRRGYSLYRRQQFQQLVDLFCTSEETAFTNNLQESLAFWKEASEPFQAQIT